MREKILIMLGCFLWSLFVFCWISRQQG